MASTKLGEGTGCAADLRTCVQSAEYSVVCCRCCAAIAPTASPSSALLLGRSPLATAGVRAGPLALQQQKVRASFLSVAALLRQLS